MFLVLIFFLPTRSHNFINDRNNTISSCSVFSCSVMSDSVTPLTVARQAPLSIGIFQARILEWIAILLSRGSSQPGIEPRSSTLQADSLPTELPGKPVLTPTSPYIHALVQYD